MSNNEKLIEDAARALYETRDDAYDMDVWEQLDSVQQERHVCDARTALAVFEKAYTPTDAQVEVAWRVWLGLEPDEAVMGNWIHEARMKARAALRAAGRVR